jgi:hypothetical protein
MDKAAGSFDDVHMGTPSFASMFGAALWIGAMLTVSSAGCGADSGGGGSGGGKATSTNTAATGGGTEGCGAKVTIAFYPDASCTPGTETGQRVYDTGQTCFSWTAAGSNAGDNSATRFQCYKDRICYTQHPNSLTCEQATPGPTDKQAKTSECLKEPSGTLYSKVLAGTDNCPAAPQGFECPESAAGMGTAAIAACSNAL